MEPPPAAPATSATSQATRFTPEMLQIRWRGFAPTVIGLSALLFAGLVLLGFYGGTAGVWTMLILGVTLGLTLTVAGMSWAGTIALADDPLRGLLFVLFPPYTFWRAIIRYDIFWQSMLVFFLGLIISFGCVLIATEALNSQFAQ